MFSMGVREKGFCSNSVSTALKASIAWVSLLFRLLTMRANSLRRACQA